MYEKVFHFSSRPFTATPFVKHYFSGDSIDQALNQARTCIDRASGPVAAIGAAGTGKSLLLAMLEEEYQSQYNVVNLACAKLEKRQDLLQSILFELQQPYQGLSDSELRFALIEYLSPSDQCVNGILLLIDEAHLLSTEMLDEVRLITNFIRDGQPRVRLVMAGNQRLEENLAEPRLESFNQRIAARCYLSNMNQGETKRYVIEHIDRAGGKGCELFNDASLKAIYEVSDGCPRLVNQVCDHALILAATRGQLVITDQCVKEAWADVQNIPGNWATPVTQPESASKLKDDESWTVIEFGQLDDADEETTEGTVYDFQNSDSPVTDSLGTDSDPDGIDEQDALSISEESMESELEGGWHDHTSNWDPSDPLQDDSDQTAWESSAWADGDEDEVLVDHSVETELPISETEDPTDHLPMDALSESKSVQAESESVEETEGPMEEVSQSGDKFDSAYAAEIEAQLRAVLGDESAANELGNEQDVADLEAEQSTFVDQEEPATDDCDSSDVDPAVSEQLAIAISRFNAAQSNADSLDKSASQSGIENVEEKDGEADESSNYANEIVEQRALEDAAVLQSDAQSDLTFDVHESHEDNLVMADVSEFENEDQTSDTSTVASDRSGASQPGLFEDTDDPFAEEFEEEEHLIDRYAPFVAHQNHSSLTVTTQDLEMIRPIDLESEMVSAANDASSEDANPGDPERSSVSVNATTIFEVKESFPESDSSDSNEESAFSEEGQSSGRPEEPDDSTAATPGVFIIQAEPADGGDTLLTNFGDSTSNHEASLPPRRVAETRVVPPASEPVQHDYANSDRDEFSQTIDIERQAEEILKRLGISQNVSCETGGSDSKAANSDNSPSVVPTRSSDPLPRATVQTVPLVTIPEPITQPPNARMPADLSDFDKQTAALDETQRILNEILAQKNLLAGQGSESEAGNRNVPINRPLQTTDSTQLEADQSEASNPRQSDGRLDDREMIIVNKKDEPSNETSDESPAITFPNTPISTGRAQRMDYQKLFDQLRDISNSQQEQS